jgi:hypothetical protein
MYASFEEKGKIFTQVITKTPLEVIIQTTGMTIRGNVFIRPDQRLKDEINSGEQFIAITDAVINRDGNTESLKRKFLLVNRDQIIWIGPADEESYEGKP